VALVHLVVVMSQGGGRLLDVQWQTPHLQSLGAVVIGRAAYLDLLVKALDGPDPFVSAHRVDSL
jgi:leucyl/phenylalanyl-tRNA--protein transferase